MSIFSAIASLKWPTRVPEFLIHSLSLIVFLFLDFLDSILCIFYQFADEFFEGDSPSCYCEENRGKCTGDRDTEVSETLHGRKNVFREMGFLKMAKKQKGSKKIGSGVKGSRNSQRWSDCCCESCVSWINDGGEQKLHVVVQSPPEANFEDCSRIPTENVIFLHGFLSSSSFWTETLYANLSEHVRSDYRLFAVDLLGFGKSPKPRDCLYTLKDHVERIEKSVIHPYELNYFHLVAHSMGCVIALALAAKHSSSVKSITLIAPPYFPCSSKDEASSVTLGRLAERSLWPPLLFGSSVMSWYEHLGRCVCFIICRNHRTWEWILKLLTRRRDLHFTLIDMTRHTHHSAWHTMHNVICGGARLLDDYLETLNTSRVKLSIMQGTRDQVVPLECSNNIQMKVPDAEVKIIANADHSTVILGREKDFISDLEQIWASVVDSTRELPPDKH